MGKLHIAAFVGLVTGMLFVGLGGLPDRALPGALAGHGSAIAATLPPPTVRAKHPKADLPTTLSTALKNAQEPSPTRHRKLGEGEWGIPANEVTLARALPQDNRLKQPLSDGSVVTFTIDPDLQKKALDILAYYRVNYGAVVSLNPKTGALLTMAEFARGKADNRDLTIQATGPAASIFKLVTATALVDIAQLNPGSRICTHGGRHRLTQRLLKDNDRRDVHCNTLAEALGSSNNVAFARWTDRLLSPAQLKTVAERFAFNRRIPFIYGVGISRATPPPGSRLGFAKAGAGFTGSTLSPLHAAMMAGSIANDGVMMVPRLVARVDSGNKNHYTASFSELTRVMSAQTAKQLKTMMLETTKPTGSAGAFFHRRRKHWSKPRIPGLSVAGKTGSLSGREAGVTRHYSWFVAFAPAEDPQIAVAALIVNDKVWSTKGAIVARELLSHWHKRQETRPTQGSSQRDAGRSRR